MKNFDLLKHSVHLADYGQNAKTRRMHDVTAMTLRIPRELVWDNRLKEIDKQLVEQLNASLARLNEMRALQINVSGLFARSKVAWKLAGYSHALLHRAVALMDGAAVAWNNRCTLSAMLNARALMETIAVIHALEADIVDKLSRQDLAGLDGLAQHGTFASRDPEWVGQFPATQAKNVLGYIDRFDRLVTGFRGHYDRLSERCHPNSLGHNFMFSKLDRTDGTIEYSDETDPEGNAQLVMAALTPVPLVESMMARISDAIFEVVEFHHSVHPRGGGE